MKRSPSKTEALISSKNGFVSPISHFVSSRFSIEPDRPGKVRAASIPGRARKKIPFQRISAKLCPSLSVLGNWISLIDWRGSLRAAKAEENIGRAENKT